MFIKVQLPNWVPWSQISHFIWFSVSPVDWTIQEDNPILQGAGLQQLRQLFHLWLLVNPQAFMWQNTGGCKLWMGVSSHMAHVQSHVIPMQAVVRPHLEKIESGTRSGQYNIFLAFSLSSGVRHLEGLNSTHTTVTSVSSVFVTADSSCLGSSLKTPVLLRLHVRSNSISGSYSRDLAPKYQTLHHLLLDS